MLLTLYPLIFQQSNTVFVYFIGNQSSTQVGNISANIETNVGILGDEINLAEGTVTTLQNSSNVLTSDFNTTANGILQPSINSIISPTGSLSYTVSGVLGYSIDTQVSIASIQNTAYSSEFQILPQAESSAEGAQIVSDYGNMAFVVEVSPVLDSYASTVYTSTLDISQNISVIPPSNEMLMTYGSMNTGVYAEITYSGSSVNIQTSDLNADCYITEIITGNANNIYAGNISGFEFVHSIFSKIEYPNIQWNVNYKGSDILQTDYVSSVFGKQERSIEWSRENRATLRLLRAEVGV